MHVIKQELLVWNSHLNITSRFKCIMSLQKSALYCPLSTLISVNTRKWMVSSIHCLFSGGSSWKYRLAVIFFTIGNLHFVNEKSPQTYTESHQYMYLLWCCVWHVYRLLKHFLPYSTFSTCTGANLTGSETCFDCMCWNSRLYPCTTCYAPPPFHLFRGEKVFYIGIYGTNERWIIF